MGEDEGVEQRSFEYLHGLQDGLTLGKDVVRRWIRDKKAPEQLFLEFVYFLERVEERKVVLIEASLGFEAWAIGICGTAPEGQ